MTTLATIPGVYVLIRKLVVEDRRSHRDTSVELQRRYPMIRRGLSERSIRRYCESHNIHATSRMTDLALDAAVRRCVAKVSII